MVDPPSETSEETERLGRYELLCPIARGGMAEVSLARTTGMGGFEKLFVVKRILPELARDQKFVQMFLDEARIAASLEHSNIVQTYEVDLADGTVFSAMEFLHGQDVRAIVERARTWGTPLPLGPALAIVLGAAAGLHYAHEKRDSEGRPLGIVHRDVSPHNVIVTYDGGVKVIDFGVAKAANKMSGTRFGMLKGKVGYMSPEQCRCEPLDRRSDVFCIAILLYELTTGTRLFGGDNEWDVLNAIVDSEIPRPSSRVPGYPPELERIVMHGLQRDRDARYATAKALQQDLEYFAREHKIAVSSSSVADFMAEWFASELESWQADQQQGVPLSSHVERTLSASSAVPAPPSDNSGEAPPLEPPFSNEATVVEQRPPKRRPALFAVPIAAVVLLGALAAVAVGWPGGGETQAERTPGPPSQPRGTQAPPPPPNDTATRTSPGGGSGEQPPSEAPPTDEEASQATAQARRGEPPDDTSASEGTDASTDADRRQRNASSSAEGAASESPSDTARTPAARRARIERARAAKRRRERRRRERQQRDRDEPDLDSFLPR